MEGKSHNQPAPVILAVDTSSKVTSLAVARGDQVLVSFGGDPDEKRSEKLWTEVGALLTDAGVGIKDVDLYAVCVGPGGFTGLRVGIAAVKGYAAATGKPVVGITSLEATAFSIGPAPVVCAMVNAYKGEVYWQMFSFDSEGVPVAINEPAVDAINEVILRLRVLRINDVLFTGPGAIEHLEMIKMAGGARFRAIPDARKSGWTVMESPTHLAGQVARLAFIRFRRGETASAEDLRACYVRASDAEIKLSLGLLGVKRET